MQKTQREPPSFAGIAQTGQQIGGLFVISAQLWPIAWAAEVPGLLDIVRKRQDPFNDATLEVLPAEYIRPALGLGSAHGKLRLAAFRAKTEQKPGNTAPPSATPDA